MYEKLAIIQKLWRGEKVSLPNGVGSTTEVNILPAPIQPELPIWLTGQSDDTFLNAGKLGFNVLTANFALNNNANKFMSKAKLYRDTIQAHHGRRGHITLMAHTFVGANDEEITTIAKPAMAEYLKVNIDMQKDHCTATTDDRGAVRKTSWVKPNISTLSQQDTQNMIDFQVLNNLRGPLSFIGTVDQCARQAAKLGDIGVDEIACLIDFGIRFDHVMSSLRLLSKLKAGVLYQTA